MGESSAPRRPTHDTSTSRREVKITNTQIHHENHWIDCIYHAASYGFSTFWSFSFPRKWRFFYDVLDPLLDPYGRDWSFGLPDDIKELLLSEALGNLRQDVPAPRGRKLALIPLAD